MKSLVLILGMFMPVLGMAGDKEITTESKYEMLPEWFAEYEPQRYHCVIKSDDNGTDWYQSECQDEREYTAMPNKFTCRNSDIGTMICIGDADPNHTDGLAAVYNSTDLCIDPDTENLPLYRPRNGILDQCSYANHGEYHEYIVPEDGFF